MKIGVWLMACLAFACMVLLATHKDDARPVRPMGLTAPVIGKRSTSLSVNGSVVEGEDEGEEDASTNPSHSSFVLAGIGEDKEEDKVRASPSHSSFVPKNLKPMKNVLGPITQTSNLLPPSLQFGFNKTRESGVHQHAPSPMPSLQMCCHQECEATTKVIILLSLVVSFIPTLLVEGGREKRREDLPGK